MSTVMIHVRFAPDGTVTEIGERPPTRSAQDWFDALTASVGGKFEALSGGRGLFRLTPDELSNVKSATAH